MPCRYYHIQTSALRCGGRYVSVRSGRVYGRGRILASGYETGNRGDVLPLLMHECKASGDIDEQSLRHVSRDYYIPAKGGERLVPIGEQS